MTISQTIITNQLDDSLHRYALRDKVLKWFGTVQTGPNQFKMNERTDSSIFTTCFALFILHLFRQTDKFTKEQRAQWISYIQNFQNEKQGYFEPKVYCHKDKERNRYQLTCFCLSALRILNAEPKVPLTFVEQWKTPDDVKRYLYEKGCHLGEGGTGNKAMFLAILLTYEYERTRERHFFDKIDAWFEFHDQTQNSNGFWGKDKSSYYFHGLQNGFHQLLVYFYWHRLINKLDRIVDVVLNIQDKDGFFAPTPGGDGCWDYDAIHTLVNAYHNINYRRDEIAKSLERAFHAILRNQNKDGGFCRSKQQLNSIIDLTKYLPFYLSGPVPYAWYYRLRKSAGLVARKNTNITTGWSKKPRKQNESNLWDTWLRCLSLAEIANTIKLDNDLGLKETNFHKMIGLGYFS